MDENKRDKSLWLRVSSWLLGGMIGAIPAAAGDLTSADKTECPSGNESVSVAGISSENRAKLLEILRDMHRNPEKIEVHSAKCYKMSMPLPEVDFVCPDCGKTSTYSRSSQEGALADAAPGIIRSLANIRPQVIVDTGSLCMHCKGSRIPAIELEITCAGCGKKKINFAIRDGEGLHAIQWLFTVPDESFAGDTTTVPPRTGKFAIDGTRLGIYYDDHEAIASGAKFIHELRFCPDCRIKYPLKSE